MEFAPLGQLARVVAEVGRFEYRVCAVFLAALLQGTVFLSPLLPGQIEQRIADLLRRQAEEVEERLRRRLVEGSPEPEVDRAEDAVSVMTIPQAAKFPMKDLPGDRLELIVGPGDQ